jgi:Uma2 family endonuclease
VTSAAELRLLTVPEYHLMVEAGVLAADERVELIDGQLFQIAAKVTAHSAAVTRIDRVLSRQLAGLALIRLQDPVQLSNLSEPETDVAIVTLDPLDYEEHHPTAAEIFWLIEVADTTLKRDLELKAPAYARSNVTEYWILDVRERCLYVLRSPRADGYTQERILRGDETIAPLAFPQCEVRLSEFLRPIDV